MTILKKQVCNIVNNNQLKHFEFKFEKSDIEHHVGIGSTADAHKFTHDQINESDSVCNSQLLHQLEEVTGAAPGTQERAWCPPPTAISETVK